MLEVQYSCFIGRDSLGARVDVLRAYFGIVRNSSPATVYIGLLNHMALLPAPLLHVLMLG